MAVYYILASNHKVNISSAMHYILDSTRVHAYACVWFFIVFNTTPDVSIGKVTPHHVKAEQKAYQTHVIAVNAGMRNSRGNMYTLAKRTYT